MSEYKTNLCERFEQLYPEEAKAFRLAASDEEVSALQQKFVREAQQRLVEALRSSGVLQEKLEALRDSSETVAEAIGEEVYRTLVNARGDDIETEIVKMFDEVERLKNMGSGDKEILTYAMMNGGLFALGFSMVTDLVTNILAALGLAEAIFTSLEAIGSIGFCAVVDIIVLSIIPIIYFMTKPAACVFLVVNDLEVNLCIESEKVIHGKLNVKTKEIPASMKMSQVVHSVGLWSTQKKNAALYGSHYAVVLNQKKSKYGTIEPDDTTFAISVECPLASGKNSCAVGINESLEAVAKDADDYRKQDVSAQNDTYGIEMHCNSGKGSIAYYICRIFKK